MFVTQTIYTSRGLFEGEGLPVAILTSEFRRRLFVVTTDESRYKAQGLELFVTFCVKVKLLLHKKKCAFVATEERLILGHQNTYLVSTNQHVVFDKNDQHIA
jgi:hypothetical protein